MATRLKIAEMDRLMTRVNVVSAMSDPVRRRLVLAELQRAHGNQFDPARFPGTSMDNWTIVTTCIDQGAISDLSLVLKMIGGATDDWAALDAVIREIFGADERAPADPRDQIRQLLATIPSEHVPALLTHEALRDHGVDGLGALAPSQVFGRLLAEPQGRRSALSFVELVAHRLGDDQAAVELHWSIDELARAFEVSEPINVLCRSLRTGGGPDPGTGAQAPAVNTSSGSVSSLEEDGVRTLSKPNTERENEMEIVTPLVWGGVPPRNTGFTGRGEILEALHRSMSSHATSALVAPLHGFGGVGKTQIATEFAYRYRSHYHLIWWIQADDALSIRRSLVSLAKRLGLSTSDDVQDTVDTVLDALRRGDPHSRWLLIYDDASEPSDVRPYLPAGPGHVLITSRSRSWASEDGAVELDVFTPQESVSLVRRRWKTLTTEMALELARRLGHLPLALDQAVSVHEQTGMPLADYLKALDDHPAELLAEGAPANYASSVAQTLGLSFKRLRETSPAAAELLELCVFLSSHPIAIPLLSAGKGADDLPGDLRRTLRSDIPLRRAIRDLGRFALVQLDAGRDFIRVHNLVRAVLRDGIDLDERDGLQRVAHAVLAAANPGDPDNPITWHAHAQIAPHVISSGLISSPDDDARHAVLDQVRYHYAIGDYAVSRSLGQLTLDTWRSGFGDDEELTLVVSRHLANALRALGEYRQARDLNQDTLRRMIATLGENHEHSLATANSVAADLRLTGQFRQALALDEDNLARHESILGPNDAATIRVMTNLAVDHRLLGNFTRSRELDEDNLERKRSLYGGEDHPRILFTYTCLVRDLYGQGHYQQGLKLAQDKIPLYEQRLASTHTEVLIARRHLAMLQRKAGYIGLALTEAQSVHEATLQKFGQEHEHSLSSLMTLMNCQRAADDLDDAAESGDRALDGYRGLLGTEHPFTYACAVDVSIVLRLRGEVERAMGLVDDAAAGLSAALGDDHPYTLCARHAQANALADANRMDEARALDEQILERSRAARGEDHPYTLACAVNLALDLDALGEQAASHTLRRATLERIKRVLGPGHPETANVGLYIRTESEIEVPAT